MARTLRSKRWRRWLARIFGWKCAICKEPLPSDWHADHIEPWSITGRTNVFEMQPTCPGCNLRKGAKLEEQVVNVKPKWDNARPGVVGAVEKAVERCVQQEKSCTIVLPTRYGKTDVARLTGCILHSRGLAPYVVCVSPALVLRKNVASRAKWKISCRRYSIPANCMKPKSQRNVPHPDRDAGANFLSVTIQMLQTQLDALPDWVDAVRRKHGSTPIFIFDECHTMGVTKEWGKVATTLMDLGCYVVLMSATPFRDDGLEIPGARYKETDRSEYVRPVVTDGSVPEKVKITLYEGTYSHREMVPDFEYTFTQAWNEPDLPMCHVGLNQIRIDVSELTSGNYQSLDQVPETQCRQVLSKCVRDPRVIKAGVSNLVRHLSQLKRAVPGAQAMVFVSGRTSDDSIDDQHVRAVEAELRSQCPISWRIVVATQDTKDANAKIVAFCGNQDSSPVKPGDGDILILKNMGSLGIDAHQCKVVLDLSPMRTLASWIQRVMRGATKYLNFQTFELITPADVLSRANLSWLTDGGTVGLKIREDESIKYDYEKERKDNLRPVWQVELVDQGDFLDSKGNIADAGLARNVNDLFEKIPALSKVVSRAELGAALAGSPSASNDPGDFPDQEPDDLDDEIAMLSKDASNLVRQAVNSRFGYSKFGYSKEHQGAYKQHCKQIMGEAKRAAGCPIDAKTKDLTVPQLKVLICVLREKLNGNRAHQAS